MYMQSATNTSVKTLDDNHAGGLRRETMSSRGVLAQNITQRPGEPNVLAAICKQRLVHAHDVALDRCLAGSLELAQLTVERLLARVRPYVQRKLCQNRYGSDSPVRLTPEVQPTSTYSNTPHGGS